MVRSRWWVVDGELAGEPVSVIDVVVDVVTQWGALGVDPRGRDEPWDTVAHLDPPGLAVDLGVVAGAEQDEVAELGGPVA